MAGFTEPPKTTDPLEILRYFQDEAYKPKSEQTGIASKPNAEDNTSSVMKFFADWWTTSQEKVGKAREELAPTMEALARESALLNAQEREAAGITQSLVEGGGEAYRKKPPEGTITRPVARPDELVTDTAKDVEESAPVTAETEGAGLMSKPLTDDDMGLPERPVYRGFEVPEYKVYNSPDEMSELEILARTIEAEAALEPYKGKIAVGATIANRASSGSYGKDIKGVILKPAQFSPWNKYTGYAKGKQGKNMMKLRASEDSYKAANAILTGNYDDPTNGATHYVNESIAEGQKWIDVMKGRKKGTVTIGNHLFGNADNNKKYDGKRYIFDRKSETTDQPLVAEPPTIKAIQRIINADVDGKFGPDSRKKAIKFLKSKGLEVPEDATNKDLMSLVVGG